MKYEIHDSHGAPQCGCEIVKFDSDWDMDDYLEEHPDVYERIREGYATVVEVPAIEKFVLVHVRKGFAGERSERVVAIVECDESVVEGICDEFCLSPYTYTTYRPYDGEKVGDKK